MKRIRFTALLLTLAMLFSMPVYAGVNVDGSGDGNYGSGSFEDQWIIKTDNGRLVDKAGLRITIVDTTTYTQPFGSIDICDVSLSGTTMFYFEENGSTVSKISWLKNTSDSAMLNRRRYKAYTNQVISELSQITIIPYYTTESASQIKTAEQRRIQSIKEFIGSKEFLYALSDIIPNLNRSDLTSGKYKIMFEPIAYFLFKGKNYALTATEVGLYNSYLARTTTDTITFTSGTYPYTMQVALGPLTHNNLPRSAYLETSDLGISSYTSNNQRYETDSTIIQKCGVGIVSGKEDEAEEIESELEYRTDTKVYTSLTFYNDTDNDIGLGEIDIWNVLGYYGNTYFDGYISNYMERDENGEFTVPVTENTVMNIYNDRTELINSIAERDAVMNVRNKIPYRYSSESISISIYDKNGRIIESESVDIICPAGRTQDVWIEWKTPSVPQEVTIKASVSPTFGRLSFNGKSGFNLEIDADVVKLEENTPPDPTVHDKKPSWFKTYDNVQESITGYVNKNVTSVSWTTWECVWYQDEKEVETANRTTTHYGIWYENKRGDFVFDYGAIGIRWKKVTHTVSISVLSTFKISPASQVPTATQQYGKWTMKSGYGITAAVNIQLTGDVDQVTGAQNGNVLFPEFNYDKKNNYKYNRLLELENGILQFARNKYSTFNERVHFTPIWFLDNVDYTVYAEVFDIWTPGGELRVRFDDSIKIDGNVYDDWYVRPYQ